MTIEQVQHLLAYLGYYALAVDGIAGDGTESAVKAFQTVVGLEADGIPGKNTQKALKTAVAEDKLFQAGQTEPTSGTFWDDIQYFTQAEFACKCGCGADDMDAKLIREADAMRKHFGRPITVSSGRRCKTHNAAAGGVSNSRHLTGKAMDFSVSGVSRAKVEAYLAKLKSAGTIRYWYHIGSGWYHMDVE